MEAPARILIVDDDPHVRTFVESALHLEGYLPSSAADGLTSWQVFQQNVPQLIILDIGLPGQDGFQLLEQVRRVADTPIIMLTTRDAEDDKVRAFTLGADDYLTKPFSTRELVARVQAVLRRGARLSTAGPALRQVGDLKIDLDTQQVWIAGQPVHLSRTEFSLLLELSRTPGRACTDRQLLVKVWGEGYRDDRVILRQAIARLRQRLEPQAEQPQYILRQQGVGYLLQASRSGVTAA